MRKILLLMAMYIGMIFSANGQTSVWDGSHSTWTNGAGTQDSPYLIENAAQLAHLAYIVNNGIDANYDDIVGAGTYWKLMTDIDLNGSESFQWTPIGNGYSFGGNFDGNNHTVANLYINTDVWLRIGLFGFTNGASIKNIGIVGTSSVTGGNVSLAYIGAIAGYAVNTSFDNCYNTGSVASSSSDSQSFSGGIVGRVTSTTINNCYNTGSVSSYSFDAGGIVGYTESTTITDCYNTGSVAVSNDTWMYCYSGGIVGYAYNSTTITDCKNTGGVSASGDSYYCCSGGIIGNVTTDDIIVTNCKNTGDVFSSGTFTSYSGGIIGSIYGTATVAAVTNCNNEGDISATSSDYYCYSGGIIGIVGSTSSTITVNNCYNAGSVSASDADYYCYSGGIIGNVGNTTINNCYNIGTIYSDIDIYKGGIAGYSSGGAVNYSYYLDTCEGDNTYGGEAKTEELMKDAGFITLLNQDLATPAWGMDCTTPINNGFPILLWQICAGSDAVETIENQSIIIYPNPAKDIITIASSELQNETYTVFSISGQALMHGKLQGETTTVNVSALASGIYFIKAGNYAGKFVQVSL